MILKLGIISDLHCHNKSKNGNLQESYILTDIDISLYQDPFKSFKKLIENNPDLSVDLLLMPGDLANRADKEGLELGWKITKEMGKLLKAKLILPNIGNHDVDSWHKYDTDSFNFVKNFSSDFPFLNKDDNEFFWSKGYITIEQENYRILIINTVHSHTSVESAEKGLISQDTINEIENEFSGINDNKVKIALCHHNPIEHSHYDTGSKDFMYNGDELISILDRFGFDLIIHGHKHDPRIRYAQGGANSPTIFSSGSFSAFKSLQLQGANNTFHIITLDCCETKIGRGFIETWFFIPTKGWKQEVRNNFFEPKIGFGAVVDIKSAALEILAWFDKSKIYFIEWADFTAIFPDLNYLIPSDLEKLKRELKTKNILISPHVFNEPVFIQYKP